MEAVKPDYSGPNVTGVVPALLGSRPVSWLPEPVAGARSTVLLVLDGLGWEAFSTHPERLPELGACTGGPVTTVVPSTTPAALTSITTGLPPARHGITGFRIRQERSVLNAIRWQLADGSRPPDPAHLQKHPVFEGRAVPVVTKSMFRTTGFTSVHLRGVDFHGWQTTSVLVEHVRRLVAEGAPFVYAYYPGVDEVAHAYGLHTAYYPAELAATDRSSARCSTRCRPTPRCWSRPTTGRSRSDRTAGSGCNRSTRWSRPTRATAGSGTCTRGPGPRPTCSRRRRSSTAGTRGCSGANSCSTRGGSGPTRCRPRTGASATSCSRRATGVGFIDPTLPYEAQLVSAHGSLTPAEMLVPLVASRGRAQPNRAR